MNRKSAARPSRAEARPPSEIGPAFGITRPLESAVALKHGHIHETWVAAYGAAGRYVHQEINTRVFADPGGLMRNVLRVTDHLRRGLARAGVSGLERRVLRVVPTPAGAPLWVDGSGRTWRTYRYVEGARSHEDAGGADRAHEAARAFGEFARLLTDLPATALAETLPGFHDLERRRSALGRAAARDALDRARVVAPELDQAGELAARLGEALEGAGPARAGLRVVHNDCKLNNVLLDEVTGSACCVIDLDTVMGGALWFDFGELVRTSTSGAAEDERELARVGFDLELFEALAAGYLEGLDGQVTAGERRSLPLAGPRMALENGIRFLTDHLEGDRYFRIHHPEHNLERCRAQLRLAGCMLERLAEARRIVERL